MMRKLIINGPPYAMQQNRLFAIHRRFNEENNEEAGEHLTPRDVVELMADLIFMPIANQIKDATYSCYDGACRTGGMLTVAQDRLFTIAIGRYFGSWQKRNRRRTG